MDKLKVLVIDDSDSMRYVISFCLDTAGGYEVTESSNGLEALGLVQANHYDIIITDINMPVMDGYDFIALARKHSRNRHVPILTLTTNTAPEAVAKGKAAGATGWLTKPFNDERLLNVMRKVAA
jgi:two-component system chemotaxis response regulator CheY